MIYLVSSYPSQTLEDQKMEGKVTDHKVRFREASSTVSDTHGNGLGLEGVDE